MTDNTSRLVAFLRGINISGKNKIDMKELKRQFEALGHGEVITYLNSGNVIFSSEEDLTILKERIEQMISQRFELEIPVCLITLSKLEAVVAEAPSWWGSEDRNIYDNLILMIPPTSCREVMETVGPPSEGIDQLQQGDGVIYWSFDLGSYRKSSWWKKTAEKPLCDKITIRTANTIRHLVKMGRANR
jgi:uncharacterized protein (DUF1697 family)